MKEYIYIACNVRKHENTKMSMFTLALRVFSDEKANRACLLRILFKEQPQEINFFFESPFSLMYVHLLLSVQRRVKSCESDVFGRMGSVFRDK